MAATTFARVFNGRNGRVASIFTSLFGTIADWNDARVTRNALNRLSDRELEDIGLIRGDINDIAMKLRR